jgi:hypothetical protein
LLPEVLCGEADRLLNIVLKFLRLTRTFEWQLGLLMGIKQANTEIFSKQGPAYAVDGMTFSSVDVGSTPWAAASIRFCARRYGRVSEFRH